MKDLIDDLKVIKAQAGENAVAQKICDVVIELIERTAVIVEPAPLVGPDDLDTAIDLIEA